MLRRPLSAERARGMARVGFPARHCAAPYAGRIGCCGSLGRKGPQPDGPPCPVPLAGGSGGCGRPAQRGALGTVQRREPSSARGPRPPPSAPLVGARGGSVWGAASAVGRVARGRLGLCPRVARRGSPSPPGPSRFQ